MVAGQQACWQHLRPVGLVARFALIAALALPRALGAAPVSGAAFLSPAPLVRLTSAERDARDVGEDVYRLRPNVAESAPASACDGGEQADKGNCLQVRGRGCMWVRLETREPSLPVQASNAYCLPCELDNEDLPCWSVGAWIGAKQVTECMMSCPHQKRLIQPGYACSEGMGGATQTQCFERGISSGSKCMFVAYQDSTGQNGARCGPCELPGTGTWTCPKPGAEGPEDGSTVTRCVSQCDMPCTKGPPECAPTLAPPPLPAPPSPGISKVAAPPDEFISAPNGIAMPMVSPAAVLEALKLAAKQAGVPYTTVAPGKGYFPVVVYHNIADELATTLPPMPASVPLWPSAWFFQGAWRELEPQVRGWQSLADDHIS